MELNERLTDDELTRLIWGLNAHGNRKRTLAGMVELKKLRNAMPIYQLRACGFFWYDVNEDAYYAVVSAGGEGRILYGH